MKNQNGGSIICDQTGKVCYSGREAGTVITVARKNVYCGYGITRALHYPRKKNIPRRKYVCGFCGYYHVTHMSEFGNSGWKSREEAFYKEYMETKARKA